MNYVLTIQGLSKSFGPHKVIDNLSLSVPEGAILGFIGQNGSGKTTTMKMVLGLLKADAGTIQVCNETAGFGQSKTSCSIGYLPDVPEFYNYMNPLEYLALCGEIAGLSKLEIRERSHELLSLTGLDGVKKRIGGFSRGMKQRLGIAQALLSRPRLLICDEPTSALDPVGRREILALLQKIKGSSAIIFSTHILSDVERICDHAAVLHNGSIAVSGTLSELKAIHGKEGLKLEFPQKEELDRFKACENVKPLLASSETKETGIIFHGRDMSHIQHTVIFALAQTGLCPIKMEVMEASLENLFLEVVM